MDLKKIKVYHLFWIISLLILTIGLIQNNNPTATLDINIHDTYYVVRNFDSTLFLFTSYFLMGLGYWLIQKIFKRQLVKTLTVIHSVILIGSFIIYWIVLFYNKRFVENSFTLDYNYLTSNSTLVLELMLILFIATPIYIINLLIGLFRKNGII